MMSLLEWLRGKMKTIFSDDNGFDERRFRQRVEAEDVRTEHVDTIVKEILQPVNASPEETWKSIGPAQPYCIRAYKNAADFTDFCFNMFKAHGLSPPGTYYLLFWKYIKDHPHLRR
jgi:hypothetical protein